MRRVREAAAQAVSAVHATTRWPPKLKMKGERSSSVGCAPRQRLLLTFFGTCLSIAAYATFRLSQLIRPLSAVSDLSPRAGSTPVTFGYPFHDAVSLSQLQTGICNPATLGRTVVLSMLEWTALRTAIFTASRPSNETRSVIPPNMRYVSTPISRNGVFTEYATLGEGNHILVTPFWMTSEELLVAIDTEEACAPLSAREAGRGAGGGVVYGRGLSWSSAPSRWSSAPSALIREGGGGVDGGTGRHLLRRKKKKRRASAGDGGDGAAGGEEGRDTWHPGTAILGIQRVAQCGVPPIPVLPPSPPLRLRPAPELQTDGESAGGSRRDEEEGAAPGLLDEVAAPGPEFPGLLPLRRKKQRRVAAAEEAGEGQLEALEAPLAAAAAAASGGLQEDAETDVSDSLRAGHVPHRGGSGAFGGRARSGSLLGAGAEAEEDGGAPNSLLPRVGMGSRGGGNGLARRLLWSGNGGGGGSSSFSRGRSGGGFSKRKGTGAAAAVNWRAAALLKPHLDDTRRAAVFPCPSPIWDAVYATKGLSSAAGVAGIAVFPLVPGARGEDGGGTVAGVAPLPGAWHSYESIASGVAALARHVVMSKPHDWSFGAQTDTLIAAVGKTAYPKQDINVGATLAALTGPKGPDYTAVKRAFMPPYTHAAVPHMLTLLNVVIDVDGVISSPGNNQDWMQMRTCARRMIPLRNTRASYDEVLSLTHMWAHNSYHFLGEALTRLYPLLPFIASKPHLKFHLWSDPVNGHSISAVHRQALAALGLNPANIVHGRTIAARVLYVPDTVVCARPHPLGMVLAREAIRGAVGLPPSPVRQLDPADWREADESEGQPGEAAAPVGEPELQAVGQGGATAAQQTGSGGHTHEGEPEAGQGIAGGAEDPGASEGEAGGTEPRRRRRPSSARLQQAAAGGEEENGGQGEALAKGFAPKGSASFTDLWARVQAQEQERVERRRAQRASAAGGAGAEEGEGEEEGGLEEEEGAGAAPKRPRRGAARHRGSGERRLRDQFARRRLLSYGEDTEGGPPLPPLRRPARAVAVADADAADGADGAYGGEAGPGEGASAPLVAARRAARALGAGAVGLRAATASAEEEEEEQEETVAPPLLQRRQRRWSQPLARDGYEADAAAPASRLNGGKEEEEEGGLHQGPQPAARGYGAPALRESYGGPPSTGGFGGGRERVVAAGRGSGDYGADEGEEEEEERPRLRSAVGQQQPQQQPLQPRRPPPLAGGPSSPAGAFQQHQQQGGGAQAASDAGEDEGEEEGDAPDARSPSAASAGAPAPPATSAAGDTTAYGAQGAAGDATARAGPLAPSAGVLEEEEGDAPAAGALLAPRSLAGALGGASRSGGGRFDRAAGVAAGAEEEAEEQEEEGEGGLGVAQGFAAAGERARRKPRESRSRTALPYPDRSTFSPEFRVTNLTAGCLAGLRGPTGGPLRVLIHKRSFSRRILNHVELESGAAALPARVTVMDDTDLPRQAEIWRMHGAADIIIAQNGAGLANIHAAAAGTAVFEVVQYHHLSLHYAHAALGLDLDYHGFISMTQKFEDIWLPVDALLGSICKYARDKYRVRG